MEMKRNVEGKDNRIIEVESRYFHVTCDKNIELLRYTQNVTLNTRQESLATQPIVSVFFARITVRGVSENEDIFSNGSLGHVPSFKPKRSGVVIGKVFKF